MYFKDDLTEEEKSEVAYHNGGKDVTSDDLKNEKFLKWLLKLVSVGGAASVGAAKLYAVGMFQLWH